MRNVITWSPTRNGAVSGPARCAPEERAARRLGERGQDGLVAAAAEVLHPDRPAELTELREAARAAHEELRIVARHDPAHATLVQDRAELLDVLGDARHEHAVRIVDAREVPVVSRCDDGVVRFVQEERADRPVCEDGSPVARGHSSH